MKTLIYFFRFLKNKVSSLFALLTAALLLFVAVPLKSQTKIVGGESVSYNALGALLLSEAEYNRLPKANWAVLRANAPRQSVLKSAESIVMLTCPPVGNQGSQGSCVAWAVGYSATAILAYPKYGNWDQARRSPAYVYNQLKTSADCSGGVFTTSALNLTQTQGVCSWEMMPYTSTCSTLPNANQKLDASLNNTTNWWTLTTTNVDGIKEALQLGYPVVVAFDVYTTSFDRMWREGGIWSTNDTSGTRRGGHACCVVGYDDTRQMFKVQNSWGASGGDNGFFWVTYDLVRNRIFRECYVLYGMNPTSLRGSKNVSYNGTATYTIMNLPSGTSVTWSTSNSNLVRTSSTSTSATFRGNAAGSCDVTARLTKSGATTELKVTNIRVSCPPLTAPRFSVPGEPNNYYPKSPSVIEFSGTLVMEDIYGRTPDDRLRITRILADPSYAGEYPTPDVSITEVNGVRRVNVVGKLRGFTLHRVSDCGASASVTYEVRYRYVPPFTIYPNPVYDYVTIEAEESSDSPVMLKSAQDKNVKYEIRIVNLQGRIMKSLQTGDISSKEISLQDLQPGLYYIHILKDGEVIQREKLIKK